MNEFISCEQWLEDLHWLNKGDYVYVVSDVLNLAKVVKSHGKKFMPDQLISKMQTLVSVEGMLMFPTFNWDFCRGIAFDQNKTPVRTGALSKKALEKEGFLRTAHPIYSFAVWGRDQQLLTDMDPVDSFGPGTIFEYMDQQDAKVLVIGLPALSGVTYIHHVEQMVGVPYRYNKEFRGTYVDREGNVSEKGYCMYVRDLDMDPKHINGFQPLEEKMKEQGLIQVQQYYGVDFSLLKVRDLDKAVREDILHNDSRNMYVYHGQS